MSEECTKQFDGEIVEEELIDLAFGMFTIFMEQQLEKERTCLYYEIETGTDLTECCGALLAAFINEYPLFAPALAMLGTSADIARLYAAGEGVVPTKTTKSYWIHQDLPGVRVGATGDEHAGKWLIFLDSDEVDAAWKKIRNATVAGMLGIGAKVSTAKEGEVACGSRKVIYVFTIDWSDEEDVMRVRKELKNLGFVTRIGYKRNIDTYAGEYYEKGKRVTYYSA